MIIDRWFVQSPAKDLIKVPALYQTISMDNFRVRLSQLNAVCFSIPHLPDHIWAWGRSSTASPSAPSVPASWRRPHWVTAAPPPQSTACCCHPACAPGPLMWKNWRFRSIKVVFLEVINEYNFVMLVGYLTLMQFLWTRSSQWQRCWSFCQVHG